MHKISLNNWLANYQANMDIRPSCVGKEVFIRNGE